MAELIYDSQDAVPEDIREDAVAKDGKYVVNVASAKKLSEFRDNNTTLSRDRDNLNASIAKIRTEVGYDPEKADDFFNEVKSLRQIKEQVDNGKLIKDTSLEEALSKKTGEMQRQHTSQIDAMTTTNNNLKAENDALTLKLDNLERDTMVGTAASLEASGIRPDAINAVKREAADVFKRRDGKFVPIDENGDIMYGADGTKAMTPLEWIKTKLSVSSPFLFKESSGGGSGGSGNGGNRDANFNNLPPAERMRLSREQSRG